MAHIIIEYSANLSRHHDLESLVATVHQAALETDLPPLAGLRTRLAERLFYRIADGDPVNAFVSIQVRIGPGRSPEQKLSFLSRVLDAAEAELSTTRSPLFIAWSAELTEIDPEFRINHNYVRTRLQREED